MKTSSTGGSVSRRRTSLFHPIGVVATLAALLALAAFSEWAADPANRLGSNDFWVYQDAAFRWLQGLSPYGVGFVSPPWFALLVVPLANLDIARGAGIWFGANIVWTFLASLAAVVFATLTHAGTTDAPGRVAAQREPPDMNATATTDDVASAATHELAPCGASGQRAPAGPGPWRLLWLAAVLGCLALWWEPHRTGLYLGQNVALLAALVGAALLVDDPSRTWRRATAGVILAVGLFKPQIIGPLVLGLAIDDLRQHRRPWLGAGVAAGLVVLVGLSFVNGANWVPDLLSGTVETWDYWGSTVTANTLLTDLTGSPLSGWVLWVPIALTGAVGLVGLWSRGGLTLPERVAATVPLTLLVTPYGYSHDYFLLVFPIALLAVRAWRPGATAADRIALWGSIVAVALAPLAVADSGYRFWYLLAPAGVLAGLMLPRLAVLAGRSDAGRLSSRAPLADG